jgi:hypothetical protein
VWGGSYWTASLQYRALQAGARLSRNIGRDSSALGYESHASMILDYLQVSHYHIFPISTLIHCLTFADVLE